MPQPHITATSPRIRQRDDDSEDIEFVIEQRYRGRGARRRLIAEQIAMPIVDDQNASR